VTFIRRTSPGIGSTRLESLALRTMLRLSGRTRARPDRSRGSPPRGSRRRAARS
jgi:hypothetical protein